MSPCIYCGVTDPQRCCRAGNLESRIAALTVELEQVSKSHTAVNAAWDAARAQLATERAAREQAEAELRSRLSDAKFHRHQALRERDTALARAAELEAQYDVLRDAFDQATASNEVGARALHAAETALASARAMLARCLKRAPANDHELHADLRAWLTSHPAPVAAPCAGCTSARTAITEALRLYAGGHEHGDVLRAWLAKAELARRAARKESKS